MGDLETYHFTSGGDMHMGRKLIHAARSYVDCHYLNGAYGARPMATVDADGGGAPNRPGGVVLIADPKRLDPAVTDQSKAIAVKAATMTVKEYCVCAGRYAKAGGSKAGAADDDLLRYLGTLGNDPQKWPMQAGLLTPRRVYGQRQGGALVWGEDCSGIRHFDCITYVNYCMSEVDKPTTYSIDMWSGAPEQNARNDKELKEAMNKQVWTSPFTGRKVYRLPNLSVRPQDGDILVGLKGVNPQHIGIVAKNGTIYQAASTNEGVHADKTFDQNQWSFLVQNFQSN